MYKTALRGRFAFNRGLRDLIDLARSKPGELSYGSFGPVVDKIAADVRLD